MLLFATIATAQDDSRRARPAPRPAPRWPDGTINLGAPPGQTGMWDGGEPLVTTIPNNYEKASAVARALVSFISTRSRSSRGPEPCSTPRHARFLADEPYTRCKPSPAARARFKPPTASNC